MKILLASSSSGSRGGGEIFLLYLAEGLGSLGHEPILWASNHPRMDELTHAFSRFGKVIRAPYRNTYDSRRRTFDVLFSGARVQRIATAWRTLAPDVLHVNKQNREDGLDLLRAAKLTGLPAVATVHITQSADFLAARWADLRDALAGRELRRFNGLLVAIQPRRADELRAITHRPHQVRDIANGVPDLAPASDFDRGAFRHAQGYGAGELVFVCIARLTAQKDPTGFLDAAKRLWTRFPQSRFIWVGDGDWATRWAQDVSDRGLTAVVRHVGWQADIRPWLHSADVYLHVAKYESFLPLSVLEAMSASVPVVIGDQLAADVPLLHEREPFLLTESSVGGVDLASPSIRAEWGARGRAMFTENFSVRAMASRYLALYEELGRSRVT